VAARLGWYGLQHAVLGERLWIQMYMNIKGLVGERIGGKKWSGGGATRCVAILSGGVQSKRNATTKFN
jgi:hypothetical protein